jgi:hypothetical protein
MLIYGKFLKNIVGGEEYWGIIKNYIQKHVYNAGKNLSPQVPIKNFANFVQ